MKLNLSVVVRPQTAPPALQKTAATAATAVVRRHLVLTVTVPRHLETVILILPVHLPHLLRPRYLRLPPISLMLHGQNQEKRSSGGQVNIAGHTCVCVEPQR